MPAFFFGGFAGLTGSVRRQSLGEGPLDCDAKNIWALAEPIAGEIGLEVLDIELAGEPSGRVLRICLDSPERGRRVSVADCTVVSRRMSDVLDAHETIAGHYMLEVSSPGVNRPLRRLDHYRRALGERVRVRVRAGKGERRTLLGTLQEVAEDGISVVEDSGAVSSVALDAIEGANVEFRFEQAASPGKKRRRRARS